MLGAFPGALLGAMPYERTHGRTHARALPPPSGHGALVTRASSSRIHDESGGMTVTDIDLDAIEARANAYWPDSCDDTDALGAAADDVRALVDEMRRAAREERRNAIIRGDIA